LTAVGMGGGQGTSTVSRASSSVCG
jgi:hypothetical protein